MTTYTDMIMKMDNLNYRGKMGNPIKRVNSAYKMMVNGMAIHTEYTNNNKRGIDACMWALKRQQERFVRLNDMEDKYAQEEYKERFADCTIVVIDRDGKETIITVM